MMETYRIGAYWGSRRETAEMCAQRLFDCLERLARIDELLSAWFLLGRSKKAAREPVFRNISRLADLFKEGAYRNDLGDTYDDLGFRIGMWNRREEAIRLDCNAGSSFHRVGNVFLLNLPERKAAAVRLYQFRTAMDIMQAVVETWDPDWMTYSSRSMSEAQAPADHEPVVGWMTYLRSAEPAVEPGGNVARHIMGTGQMFTIGHEVTDVSATAVTSLRAELAQAGAFSCLP